MRYGLMDLRREYARLDERCGVDTRGIVLRISARARGRLGLFRPGPPPSIEISAFVLDREDLFWDTARHEYAHALVWLRDPGSDHGHDAVWKAACLEVGCTPRATVRPDQALLEARTAQARYRVVCERCGQESIYLRAGKIVQVLQSGSPHRLRCKRCGSADFRLETLHPAENKEKRP
ncbi:MAG: SprT-like domain-containing protein [Oscillospiraceae bacterium]|nr:SprT-like domain-containing protein [Oscillospiraceae bacterium]